MIYSIYSGIAFPFSENKKIPKTKAFQNAHFGYKVSSGTFFIEGKQHKLYAASAPSYGSKSDVTLFKFNNTKNIETVEQMLKFFSNQTGEYFGYTFLVEDFNNNQKSDIAISAPFHTNDGKHEHGCVYVFMDGSKIFVNCYI